MRTRVRFTINWLYVLLGLSFLWGWWVTYALSNTIQIHERILEQIDDLNQRQHFITSVLLSGKRDLYVSIP